jgi:rhodanese-related sulfurtransferase
MLHTAPGPNPWPGRPPRPCARPCRRPCVRTEEVDVQGWPLGEDAIALGPRQLLRLPECRGYVLRDALGRLPFAFVGEAWSTAADEPAWTPPWPPGWHPKPSACPPGRPATWPTHRPRSAAPAHGLLQAITDLPRLARSHEGLTLVDVREAHEQGWDDDRLEALGLPRRTLPLSQLLNALQDDLAGHSTGGLGHTLLFVCRSGRQAPRPHGCCAAWAMGGPGVCQEGGAADVNGMNDSALIPGMPQCHEASPRPSPARHYPGGSGVRPWRPPPLRPSAPLAAPRTTRSPRTPSA